MKKLLILLLCLATPLFIGFLGSMVTTPSIPTWYANLNKPFFCPPNWIFAPVWTSLYLMMGLASYVVLQQKKKKQKIEQWLKLYSLHLGVNWLWSLAFFNWQQPLTALLIIAILWVCIFLLIKKSWSFAKPASWLLFPYLAWVSFASILNAAIVYLN